MAKVKRAITPEDRRRDAERAIAEHKAEADAVNKNMARLRALRLEREALGAAPVTKEKKVEPKQPASVAQYLKHQRRIGRA